MARPATPLQGSGQIQKFTSQNSTLGAALAPHEPRALAVTADGKKLLVSQFISTATGTVRTVSPERRYVLPLEVSTPDVVGGRGLPNYLAGIAADPANGIAWS
jgi:DNA-binding beta-propeller fold protein YncE